MNKVVFVFFTGLLVACSHPSADKSHVVADKALEKSHSVTVEELKLESFSGLPAEVEGCSCYYASDSVDFSKGHYIYVDDNDETAFVKINGELMKFRQTKFNKKGETNWEETYKSGQFELFLEVRELEQNGDETWLYTGTLKLSDGKGRTVNRNFYGECGC